MELWGLEVSEHREMIRVESHNGLRWELSTEQRQRDEKLKPLVYFERSETDQETNNKLDFHFFDAVGQYFCYCVLSL